MSWACCVEICLKTFEEQKQLRLPLDLVLRNEAQQLRCESAKKLRFRSTELLFSSPAEDQGSKGLRPFDSIHRFPHERQQRRRRSRK